MPESVETLTGMGTRVERESFWLSLAEFRREFGVEAGQVCPQDIVVRRNELGAPEKGVELSTGAHRKIYTWCSYTHQLSAVRMDADKQLHQQQGAQTMEHLLKDDGASSLRRSPISWEAAKTSAQQIVERMQRQHADDAKSAEAQAASMLLQPRLPF